MFDLDITSETDSDDEQPLREYETKFSVATPATHPRIPLQIRTREPYSISIPPQLHAGESKGVMNNVPPTSVTDSEDEQEAESKAVAPAVPIIPPYSRKYVDCGS